MPAVFNSIGEARAKALSGESFRLKAKVNRFLEGVRAA
jgi:hypothetical protein